MRLALLGQTALLLSAQIWLSSGEQTPAPPTCPRALDCARLGRHFCRHGDGRCGPCLSPLEENSRGRCVVKRRRSSLHRDDVHREEQHRDEPHRDQQHRDDVHREEPHRDEPHRDEPHPRRTGHDRGEHRGLFPELDEEIDVLSAVISEQRSQTLTAPPTQEAPQPMRKGPAPTETSTNHSLPSSAPPTAATNHSAALQTQPRPLSDSSVFIVMSSVFVVTGSVALMVAGACWVRLQRGGGVSPKLDFPSYGLKRPDSFNLPGDHRLVQSAQMFHYQHQRAQLLSLDRHRDSPRVPDSGASTEDENEDDFTVYECPGLAPTGEMEVKNPLFDDSTLYFHRFHK